MRFSWTRRASGTDEGSGATDPATRRGRFRFRRRHGAVLVLAPIAVLAGLVVRAEPWFFPSRQITVPPAAKIEPRPGFAERLSRALRFPTIARRDPSASDLVPFVALREALESDFPEVHRHLEREIVGGYSLLFRWPGTDPAAEPILMMAPLDVVAGDDEPEHENDEEPGVPHRPWTYPPFSGAIADGFLWGRGALDVKSGAVGLLEAAETLLARGFRPTGDVYFALGHDEETGGRAGNRRIAELLAGRGVRFRFVLDEGGSLTEGILNGIEAPVAFVGIAEKGYATIRIEARSDGGHSSMPPRHTAVGLVAAAIAHLEKNPFPARIDGASAAMLDFLGPEMPRSRRIVLANRWLTGGLIARLFGGSDSLNAVVRTTMAATVVRGGATPNVLPQRAEALVNLRLLPGDTSESALRRVRAELARLGFGEDVLTCSLDEALSEPSRISSVDSAGFRTLHRTIAETYPDAVVAPGLSMVATDSRHYAAIARDIYRFLPLRVTDDDLERIHGVDERIGVETYADMIGFLARLIENLSSGAAPDDPSASAGHDATGERRPPRER